MGPGTASKGAFVGRAAELALLAGRISAAAGGEGGVVLIGGEPGIGKTRLAAEAAARAAAAGLGCVRSRAVPDEGCPPYWLFRPALRDLPQTFPPNEFQRAHLTVIAPGPPARPPRLDGPAMGSEQRFAVFESVREYLTAAAAGTGLLLLFDDVHWADPPSLRLLRHLADGVAASRLLLLITYRDTETGGRDELTAFLAALARQDAVTRISLTGLTQDEVGRQLAAVTGGAVAPADRRRAAHLRADRGEPRPAHPHPARPAHPHPDRGLDHFSRIRFPVSLSFPLSLPLPGALSLSDPGVMLGPCPEFPPLRA